MNPRPTLVAALAITMLDSVTKNTNLNGTVSDVQIDSMNAKSLCCRHDNVLYAFIIYKPSVVDCSLEKFECTENHDAGNCD